MLGNLSDLQKVINLTLCQHIIKLVSNDQDMLISKFI